MSEDYLKDPYPRPGYKVSGLYRGVVEDDNDPEYVGRVRVRVPSMHGVRSSDPNKYNTDFIPTWGLPWSVVCNVGAGFDQGSYITPEVGSTVIVGFEDDNPDKPVVLGGVFGTGSTGSKDLGNLGDRLPDETYEASTYKKSDGVYPQRLGIRETPSDAFDDPKNKIIYKSPKGATISIIENDGIESVNIVDHAGQVIRMVSPFTDDANNYNSSKRWDTTANDGQGAITDVSDQPHMIEIVGTNGGFTRLISELDGTTTYQIKADKIVTSSEINVVRSDTVTEMAEENERLTREADQLIKDDEDGQS